MTTDDVILIREVTMWVVFSGIVSSAGFILLYGFTSPWWRSPGGRHLMSFAVAAFLLFVWGFLALYIGDYPGRRILRVAVAASFVGLSWWRFLVLLHLHFGLLHHRQHDEDIGRALSRRSEDEIPRREGTDAPPS